MATPVPQNYANHVRVDRRAFAAAFLYIGAIFLVVIGLVLTMPVLTSIAVILVCLAGTYMGAITRGYAVKLQDRIIRLEMRLRCERILPDELKARIPELAIPQLIGLRFASDEELPELVEKALDENLTKADDIKKLIKKWVPDYHRV